MKEEESSLEDGIETFSENLLFGKTARIVYVARCVRTLFDSFRDCGIILEKYL